MITIVLPLSACVASAFSVVDFLLLFHYMQMSFLEYIGLAC